MQPPDPYPQYSQQERQQQNTSWGSPPQWQQPIPPQQQWYPQHPPYQPPMQQYPPYQQPPTPTKKSHKTLYIVLGVVVGVVLLPLLGCIGISALEAGGSMAVQQAANSTATQTAQFPSTQTTQPVNILTPSKTYAQFGDGMFQVGKDIQPGTYRTRVGSPGCYYARLRGFNTTEIISNDNTDAPAIITIVPTDIAFESRNCGTWAKDLSAITTSKTSFGDGMFIVGTDIEPGTYRNSGSVGCYYAILSAFDTQAISSNDNTDTV